MLVRQRCYFLTSSVTFQESEQMLVVNDDNLPSVNRAKRFCDGNVCSEAFREIPSSCMLASCTKRALQEDVGPFWANRGKRNPNYKTETLYANEPHWVLVRRANDEFLPYKYNYEPFFITRGKKDKKIEEDSNSIIQEMFGKMRIRNHQDSEIKNTE
uniref:Uncharacterized protein n=1 Tax=Photinus pyralis TaxID=7054 RepID=A0A1Y1LHK7_PHOPY